MNQVSFLDAFSLKLCESADIFTILISPSPLINHFTDHQHLTIIIAILSSFVGRILESYKNIMNFSPSYVKTRLTIVIC